MPAKYQILAQILREDISRHITDKTYRLPTERELSERFDLSRHTVRKALEILSSEGLISKRQGSGSYASPDTSSAAMQIAVIVTFVDEYIFPKVLHDMESLLQKQGYVLTVHTTFNRVSVERQILSEILKNPVGGILVEGSMTALPNPNADLYAKIKANGTPVVFFQGNYSTLPMYPAVIDDNYTGGYILAEYLIKKGHKRIGGIFKSDDIQGVERYHGMMNAIRDAGLELPDHNICWYDTDQRLSLLSTGDQDVWKRLYPKRLADTTAVICYNDEIAYRFIQVLKNMKKSVPDDIAVVSFDNSYLSQISPVPITSMRHSSKNMGSEAAKLILNLLRGKSVRSISLPWELVERKSG